MDKVRDGFRVDGCKLSHAFICFFSFSLVLDIHPKSGHFDHYALLKSLKITKKSREI